jgi:hypothetical protein
VFQVVKDVFLPWYNAYRYVSVWWCVCVGGGGERGGGVDGGGEGRGRLLQANTSPLNGTLHKRQHGMVLECKRLPRRA